MDVAQALQSLAEQEIGHKSKNPNKKKLTLNPAIPQHSSGSPSLSLTSSDAEDNPDSPVSVSAEILKTLATRGRESLGGELEGVVITVPARQ